MRLLLIWIMLRDLAPAPPYVTLGPPHTVETRHPEVCVHTRLTDEVEEWKIQRTLQLVREMGAATIVEFFPWPYVEGSRGNYNWAHADRIIRHAENQGLTVIARLGLAPDWARPPVHEKVTTLTYLEADYFDEFAAFVGAFVARYPNTVTGVIIWNEPNLSGEWGSRPPDPEAYTELLRLSYAAAHAARPDILVLGGALAPTNEPEDSGGGMNEFRYLERMYEAGAGAYFDVLSAHTYGFTHPPDAEPDPGVINFRRVELLRAIMERYGDGDKPVTITEGGWNDDPRWANAVRPGQRIVYTLTAFEMVEAWPWADHLCLWIFRQPIDLGRRRDAYYALVSADFAIKPIYDAVQAYAHGRETPYTP
ncbi:MAG: endo-1,4-beta-xylanase [Anaerolineae bacterium]|nr:endo-1,4-beta-xylanase [Anaerolineae bacterium]